MKPAPPVTRIFTPEHLESRVSAFSFSASYTIDGTPEDVRERPRGAGPVHSKKDRRGLHEKNRYFKAVFGRNAKYGARDRQSNRPIDAGGAVGQGVEWDTE